MSDRELPLARSTVDRAAHRRRDVEWLGDAWRRARVLIVDAEGRAMIDSSSGRPRLVLVGSDAAPDGERFFLGEEADAVYFAVRGELPAVDGGEPHTVRAVGADLDARDAGLFVQAVALANWHDNAAYSPGTGAPTASRDGGWVRVPEDGSGPIFPRTDPAMIVLVHDGVSGPSGRALLGRQASWPPGRYSTLAGFVEPGESAEAAVVREVAEETGVTVTDVRYVGSQPWPFPASLMLGFTALADPAEPIRMVDDELDDAQWFTRDQVRAQRDAIRALPMTTSIAYHLITAWLEEL